MADEQTQPVDLLLDEALFQKWEKEIAQAQEREKNFRKEGRELCEIYEGDKVDSIPYNILYSNTETMGPAVYNSLPRPIVQRRFKDDDPLGMAASEVCRRALEYLIDSDIRDYPTFDTLMSTAVTQALVPGRGVSRFKYDAIIVKADPQTGAATDTGAEKDIAEGTPLEDEANENKVLAAETGKLEDHVDSETVFGEPVTWDRFLHGFAWKWKDVPWVSYEWPMDQHELKMNFGDSAALIELTDIEKVEDSNAESGEQLHKTTTKGAWVYEIWDKQSRKVYFWTPSYKKGVLRVIDDPLGLSGFFPTPEPLQFVRRVSSLVPVALYQLYKQQAKELNRVTTRINRIINALKVRGFYDKQIEGIDKVLKGDDNEMVPLENVAALTGQGFTLDKALFFVPIEKLVAVVQQLYISRQQIKQVIYEITGIADIMRGSSQASETLGAQEIKTQWGTLRLKRSQKEVARYARDSLRIMAEIAFSKLSPQTLKAMTGVEYPMQAEKEQAQLTLEQAALGGQPADPAAQQLLQLPSMEELCALLRDDIQRSYRIDIETNSTVDLEATEDKQDMAEMLNAISQFLNGVAPAVEQGILPFEAAKAMLLGVVRKFRFGSDVEKYIKQMQPPQPKQDDGKNNPEVAKAEGEAALMKAQAEIQKIRQTMELEQERMQHEREKMAMQREQAQLQHRLAMEKLAAQAVLGAGTGGQKRPAKPGQNTAS